MRAVALFSGGLDSSVMMYKYRVDISRALYFDYGSTHKVKELAKANSICDKLSIPLSIIDIKDAFGHIRSALLGSVPIPEKYSANDDEQKKTVVPFRNGIMLSIAGGIAESEKLDTVMIANHSGDRAIYPDCRSEFISIMSAALYAGTDQNINIFSPFLHLSKREIAYLGYKAGLNFSDTYSCYKGGDVHCGVCAACLGRKDALFSYDTTEYLK